MTQMEVDAATNGEDSGLPIIPGLIYPPPEIRSKLSLTPQPLG